MEADDYDAVHENAAYSGHDSSADDPHEARQEVRCNVPCLSLFFFFLRCFTFLFSFHFPFYFLSVGLPLLSFLCNLLAVRARRRIGSFCLLLPPVFAVISLPLLITSHFNIIEFQILPNNDLTEGVLYGRWQHAVCT